MLWGPRVDVSLLAFGKYLCGLCGSFHQSDRHVVLQGWVTRTHPSAVLDILENSSRLLTLPVQSRPADALLRGSNVLCVLWK